MTQTARSTNALELQVIDPAIITTLTLGLLPVPFVAVNVRLIWIYKFVTVTPFAGVIGCWPLPRSQHGP